jgi:DNA-binding SARP family transcriptional activator
MAAGMAFGLLGPLTVRVDGLAVPIPRGKQRVVLAALLLHAGRTVTADQLAELLWGPAPPPSAAVTLQNYVKRLRQAFSAGRDRIVTQPGGYLIQVDPGELDIAAMEETLASAHHAAQGGAWPDAARHACAALAFWRGDPLCDIDLGVLALQEIARLTELRFQARALRIEAGLRLGRHAELVPEGAAAYRRSAARAPPHALLMRALANAATEGRSPDAYQARAR